MCEPYHSSVQYKVNDDPIIRDDDQDNNQDNSGGGSTESRLQWGLGKIYDWGKKIRSWFHFSSLGSGHTESIQWAKTKHLYLPQEARYECAWWNRLVKFDSGRVFGDKGDAIRAATEYSNVVCIGDIQKFRRFFETSIQKTLNPYLYFETFMVLMLTTEGRDKVHQDIIRCFGHNALQPKKPIPSYKAQRIASLMLGYTRKRSLLVPEWSDCPHLWIKG